MGAKLNVFMVGGRRCGKTTILSKVYREFNSILKHEETGEQDLFMLNAQAHDIPHIRDAENAILGLFNDNDVYDDFIVEDYNCTPDMSEIRFSLQPTIGSTPLEIGFRDIPGEWCSGRSVDGSDTITAIGIDGKPETKNPLEFVKDYIKVSTVTMIAIDTPAMIEEHGAFNETINRIGPITEAFKAIIETGGDENISDKLVLFVPLKCEKYVVKGDGSIDNEGMKRVAIAVRDSYKELIDFLGRPPLNDSVSAAILPILTIKEVLWAKYGCYWKGEKSSIYNEQQRPRIFPKFYDANNLVYSYFSFRNEEMYDKALEEGSKSEYCEQPLVYSLVYSMNHYLYRKKHPARVARSGFFGTIFSWYEKISQTIRNYLSAVFNLYDSNGDFRTEAQRLSRTKMIRRNGFEIIQDKRNLLG